MSITALLPRRRTTAAYARGVEHGRGEAVEFLRTQAAQIEVAVILSKATSLNPKPRSTT